MTLRVSAFPRPSLTACFRSARLNLPFPLAAPGCRLFARARHAVWQGVYALGLAPGDGVLVPAYHHGAEVEALERAGLVPVWYDTGPILEPDADELDSLAGPGVRALYLIHYFGFPQEVARWRAWCDERGLFLLEDCAHAWGAESGGRPVGAFADLAVFSLAEALGLPDGGAMLVRAPPPGPEARPPLGLLSLRLGRRPHQTDGRDPADEWALGDPGMPPASATLYLLKRSAIEPVAARRRANYASLLADLGDHSPAPFAELPDGASPFLFPIASDEKGPLLARLRAAGVEAVDLFPRPHPALPRERFPGAAARRARHVGLPVHQELRPRDLEHVTQSVVRRTPRAPALVPEPVEDLESIADEWGELAGRTRNIFATPEWLSAWWRHFGAGRPLFTTALRDRSGRLVAVLPLYLASGAPLRVLRFLGHGPSDQLGPVCSAADRVPVGRAIRRLLDEAAIGWDLLAAEQLPADQGWSGLLGARTVRVEGSPIARFVASTWDEHLGSLSSALRQELRYDARRLAREHHVAYRLADDPERLGQDLETLFALHAKQRPEGASAFVGDREAFHRDFAATAFDRGWLRLWFLEVDGQPVAAKYNFRFGGLEFSYQAGRDPAWRRFSVGLVILAHAMKRALEEGVREYRFLRGGEQYKYRLATSDPGLETMALAEGRLGRAALAVGLVVGDHISVSAVRQRIGG